MVNPWRVRALPRIASPWEAGGTLHYAEVYLKVVKRVESLARSALKEPARVRPLRSRYEVDVKFEEILRESFP